MAGHIIVAYAVISAVLTGVGLLLTHELGAVTSWDERVNRTFAEHRTVLWNHVANAGTWLAGTWGVVLVAVLVTGVLLVLQAGRGALLVIYGLIIELSAFATVNALVARPRPTVSHLESTPSTYSFPSGHTAATFVLYGAIAVATGWLCRHRKVTVAVWVLVGAVTVWVGLSRVYAGEHHPTDVVAGLLLGAAALRAAVLAVRASARGRVATSGTRRAAR